jgi:hexosaminidase
VEDGPRLAWRGAMLDTARNFMSVEFIERFIDRMALHKLNRFHWHLTDDQAWRLEIPELPEITRRGATRLEGRVKAVWWKGGSYSPEDVRRVVAFAAERGIVVVPEIETPGHVVALLASHPELSCAGMASGEPGARLCFEPEDRYGVFEDVLCAGNEAVFSLLGKVYDHVAAVFPGPWVHAGGDEVPKARWQACPRCRERMKAEGLRDQGGALEPELLQGWFMNRVAALLAERGKRMIGWDEILEGKPRKDAIVMSWRGYSGGIEAAGEGYEVVMSPQTKACYLDHKHLDLPEEPGQLGTCTVRDSYEFEPVPPSLSPEAAGRILGGQANIWTELMYFGRQVEYMAYPRLSALSEAFWSPQAGRAFADFAARLPIHGKRLERLGLNWYRGPLE